MLTIPAWVGTGVVMPFPAWVGAGIVMLVVAGELGAGGLAVVGAAGWPIIPTLLCVADVN